MGFYPPDALVHEAQRRGIEVLPPDVNASDVGCAVTEAGGVRLGLGYVAGRARRRGRRAGRRPPAGGPFRSLDDLASRAGAGRPALDRLAWSGACDALALADAGLAVAGSGVVGDGVVGDGVVGDGVVGDGVVGDGVVGDGVAGNGVAGNGAAGTVRPTSARRTALWRLGIAAPAYAAGDSGTQLSLAVDLPQAPALAAVSDWDAMIADYATTGLTIDRHPLRLLRDGLTARGTVSSAGLADLPHGAAVRVGGLVVARQRPGTAKGVVFLLIEDETGTVNVDRPAARIRAPPADRALRTARAGRGDA